MTCFIVNIRICSSYDPSTAVAQMLEQSTMTRSAQLNTDLALSDSDDEMEAKRARPGDYENMHLL